MALTQSSSEGPAWSATELHRNICRVIELHMIRLGLDRREQLAERSGIPKGTLDNRFSGKAGKFTADDLMRLAYALEISPALFFEPTDEILRSRCVSASMQVIPGGLSERPALPFPREPACREGRTPLYVVRRERDEPK